MLKRKPAIIYPQSDRIEQGYFFELIDRKWPLIVPGHARQPETKCRKFGGASAALTYFCR